METGLQITESELSKVENKLNKEQLNFLFAPTPEAHKYQRPAKGGGKWTYVTGIYVKKVLNLMFGWDWDFEVVKSEYNLDFKQAIVLGKLTVRVKGNPITKTQFGRQDIKFKVFYKKDENGQRVKDIEETERQNKPLDLGNDLKGATTDALKKCAAEFGICGDVYGPNEYKSITIIEDVEPRTIDELQALIDNATNIDELQILWSSFNQDEQAMATTYMNMKKEAL